MKQKTQHWNAVTAIAEVVQAGVPQTGKVITAKIYRIFDQKWWNAAGGTWDAAPVTNNMIEPDSTNLPGIYHLKVTPAALDYAKGLSGYYVVMQCAAIAFYEDEFIGTFRRSDLDETSSLHVTAGTMGEMLFLIKGLVQGNQRIKNMTYDLDGRPLSGELVVYPTALDAQNDINELKIFTMTATYDGAGNVLTKLTRE